jgi:hypothetical protein
LIEWLAAIAAFIGAGAAWAGARDARRSAAKTESALRLDAIASVIAVAREVIAQRDRIERAVEDYSRSEQSAQDLLRPGERYGWIEKMAREMMTTHPPFQLTTVAGSPMDE